jgi:hypothetical protein
VAILLAGHTLQIRIDLRGRRSVIARVIGVDFERFALERLVTRDLEHAEVTTVQSGETRREPRLPPAEQPRLVVTHLTAQLVHSSASVVLDRAHVTLLTTGPIQLPGPGLGVFEQRVEIAGLVQVPNEVFRARLLLQLHPVEEHIARLDQLFDLGIALGFDFGAQAIEVAPDVGVRPLDHPLGLVQRRVELLDRVPGREQLAFVLNSARYLDGRDLQQPLEHRAPRILFDFVRFSTIWRHAHVERLAGVVFAWAPAQAGQAALADGVRAGQCDRALVSLGAFGAGEDRAHEPTVVDVVPLVSLIRLGHHF